MSIDTHIHLFTRALPRAPGSRHNPAYDATIDQLLMVSAGSGVDQFVVVQPSFLGFDNSYLLEQIERNPTRLAGVAVLDPATTEQEIAQLRQQGIRGMRLNLLGRDLNQELADPTLRLVQRAAEQGLHVEIHDEVNRLPYILGKIGPLAQSLVIDHFGRPNSAAGGLSSPEFEALLRAGEDKNWFVKISAPYRCAGVDVEQAYLQFKKRWGSNKLLWGSDWPWTQHESLIDYASWCRPFSAQDDLPALLSQNAQRLFQFPVLDV